MFARKNQIPKSQLPDKCKFVEHYFHTLNRSERKWDGDYIQVLSIDPAVKNLAIRIERWYKNKTIVPVYFNKHDLLEQKEDDESYNYAFYSSLILLKKLEPLIQQTHVFIIEKQLPVNYKVVRISQHLITFIGTAIHNNKLLASIYEVDPKLKGEMFGAGKISEAELKDWSVKIALELLNKRNDSESLKVFQMFPKKQDDLADTIMQTCALFQHILSLKLNDILYLWIDEIFNKVYEVEQVKPKLVLKIN